MLNFEGIYINLMLESDHAAE